MVVSAPSVLFANAVDHTVVFSVRRVLTEFELNWSKCDKEELEDRSWTMISV